MCRVSLPSRCSHDESDDWTAALPHTHIAVAMTLQSRADCNLVTGHWRSSEVLSGSGSLSASTITTNSKINLNLNFINSFLFIHFIINYEILGLDLKVMNI